MRKLLNNQTDLSLATAVFYLTGCILVLFSGLFFRDDAANSVWILIPVVTIALGLSVAAFVLGYRLSLKVTTVMMTLTALTVVILTVTTGSVLGAINNGIFLIIVFLYSVWFFPMAYARFLVYTCLIVYTVIMVFSFDQKSYGVVFAIVLTSVMIGEILYMFKSGMETRTLTDQLTGAWNKRGLERVLSIEIPNARRSGKELSVLFMDLDDLKYTNDTFGHREGDRILRDFVSFLNSHTRPRDALARLGGDEFVLVLPETDAAEAAAIGSKLRSDGACLWSFGAATWLPDESAEDIVNRADLMMIADKRRRQQGRRVNLQAAQNLPERDPSPASGAEAGAPRS